MADYLRRLVARASGHPVSAPPVRPLARPRERTADGDVEGLVEVALPPAPPVATPLRTVSEPRPPHDPRAGSLPGVAPRPGTPAVPHEPFSRPAPDPATEPSRREKVRAPGAPLLRREPGPDVTTRSTPTPGPAVRPVLPAPPTPAAPVPPTLEWPASRIEQRPRPAVRDAATVPVMRPTHPEPAVPRERPAPPAPQLHIGSIHVEVMPTPPRAAAAPRAVAPAVDGSALTGSSLLGQRFGLGQL